MNFGTFPNFGTSENFFQRFFFDINVFPDNFFQRIFHCFQDHYTVQKG